MANPKKSGYPSRAKARTARRKERKVKYLVVTEGVRTEAEYFDLLRGLVDERFGIQLINRPGLKGGKAKSASGWKSNPLDVVKKCIEIRDAEAKKSRGSRLDTLPFARCFAVVDLDEWDKGQRPTPLDKATKLAAQHDICVIVSNTKFESWVVWHHSSATPASTSERLDQQVKRLGYMDGKSLLPGFPLHEYEHVAQRAQKHHPTGCCDKGPNPSSAMPQLFLALAEDSIV